MTNPRIQSNDQRGYINLGATASFEIPESPNNQLEEMENIEENEYGFIRL